MKIALVMQRFCPHLGGGEKYAADLASRLLKEGHEVHVFANIWDKSLSACFHKVPIFQGWDLLSFAVNSARQLRKEKFDLIQGFGETYYVDVTMLGGGCERVWLLEAPVDAENPVMSFLKRLGKILRVHNLTHLMIERKRCREGKNQKVIVSSEMVKKQLSHYYRLPDEKVVVIRNGVDLKKFHPRNRDRFRREIREKYQLGEEMVILFVAHNFALKGLRFLLKALALLKDKGRFQLAVVGRGKILKYKNLAEKLGLGTKVVFAGPVQEMERYYGASDILVHPTLYDPFAGVCIEALASGLPVITTKHNGVSEIITDGQEGFIVDDPKNIELLAERIQQLLNKERRRKFSRAARARAEEFSFEHTCQNLVQVYEEVRRERKNEDNAKLE